MVVAHPGQLRLIFKSKRKHDRVDAQKLARLLLMDLVPPVHVPREQVRHWRQMIEFRRRQVDRRVAIKKSLRSLLRAQAVVVPREVGRLWSRKGLAWLQALELPGAVGVQRDMLLEDLRHYQKQIERVTHELDRMACEHPGVQLLQTMPGIGPRTAEAFVAYIDQPGRFANARQVGTYVGLVPCEDSSGGTQRLGHITREGPGTLRKLLVEASWQATRKCPRLGRDFERLVRGDRDRRKIAIAAMARKMAGIMWAMMNHAEPYRSAA